MIFAIDHVVLAVTPDQRKRFVADLSECGFRQVGLLLDFPEIGAASESLAYRGGGFVEFVYPRDGASSPPRVWFQDVPRVIGLGFASDSFSSDAAWEGDEGAWIMNEDKILPDGSTLNIHAAGPHEHLSDFYIFVMDREAGFLQFPEVMDGPELAGLTFAGEESGDWRERIQRWLRLPTKGDALLAGGIELVFAPGSHPRVRVTPTFVLPAGGEGPATDVRGTVELIPSPRAR